MAHAKQLVLNQAGLKLWHMQSSHWTDHYHSILLLLQKELDVCKKARATVGKSSANLLQKAADHVHGYAPCGSRGMQRLCRCSPWDSCGGPSRLRPDSSIVWASNNYETGLFSWAGCWYGWQEGDRHGLCGRLPSVWSRYLAAWESTWFPGRTEQHADYLVITSLHSISK